MVSTAGFRNGGAVPDGDPTGLADLRNIASPITSIDDISVSLKLSGTWNGDIYATLQHDSGFAVLLNRVGSNAGNSFGYGDDGFDVVFNDLGGFADIHSQTSGGGLLTGIYGSDGRITDPSNVVDGDSRDALLDSFVGLSASGDWTLFLADLANGDNHVLESWSMEITGTEVIGVPDGGQMQCFSHSHWWQSALCRSTERRNGADARFRSIEFLARPH